MKEQRGSWELAIKNYQLRINNEKLKIKNEELKATKTLRLEETQRKFITPFGHLELKIKNQELKATKTGRNTKKIYYAFVPLCAFEALWQKSFVAK